MIAAPKRMQGPQTGARVHPAVVQAATEFAFRRVADELATRIDELRLLGNGVCEAQGALAFRTLVRAIARRSTRATQLVRLMEHA